MNLPSKKTSVLKRIGLRLTLSYTVILALFIGVSVLTAVQLQGMSVRHDHYAKNDLKRLLDIQYVSLETEGIGLEFLIKFANVQQQTMPDYASIDEQAKHLDMLMEQLRGQVQDIEEKASLLEVIAKHAAFRASYFEVLDDLELNGVQSARKLYFERTEALRIALVKESKVLLEKEKREIQRRQAEEQVALENMQLQVFFLSLCAIVIGAKLAYITRRAVVQPLGILEASALDFAAGNYSHKVPELNTIEVARVGRAFNNMVEAIAVREREIEQLAYYDGLSHLPNRTKFYKHFHEVKLIDHCLILMDIARLKIVNETLGFSTGDSIILEASKRLSQVAQNFSGNVQYLAKFSGGMFVLLLKSGEKSLIEQTIKAIQDQMAEPIHCGQHAVDVSLVFGIAVVGTKTTTLEGLVRNAEIALYVAKAQTRAVAWYSDAQEESRLSHLSLISDLRTATHSQQLQIWLQPKLHLADMCSYGFEALVRWQHPTRGFISPAEFIPFAERTGYIQFVTNWMLENTLELLSQWKTTYPQLSIAVNISTLDLLDRHFPDRVRELIRKYAINPQLLHLELTESGIMQDPDGAIESLQKLREIGLGLSIDDFGTGHSSLAYLQKLPVTELKIDRSFVINIDQLPSTQRLVKTIVEMGQGLGLSVIAEGIETQAERDTLEVLGCDAMQGYFASKPLHGPGLLKWLTDKNSLPL
ncbi:MAG: EAL domain-containing protein [Undibacterium sp.]|nr:EAL domain-containing protein [Undibacterium sp.]